MSGTSEFLVSLNARTMREVADFVGAKLAPIEGVASTVTMFVLKKYKVNGVTMDLKEEIKDDRMIVSAWKRSQGACFEPELKLLFVCAHAQKMDEKTEQ